MDRLLCMARHKIKENSATPFTTLLLISLALLFLPQSITKNLNFFFIELFKPFLSIGIDRPKKIFLSSDTSGDIVSRAEYDRLWRAYKNIESELLLLEDKYETLAKYRLSMPLPGPALMPAGVVTTQPSQEIIIDRGSNDGIKKGFYVLGADSIIGEVIETSPSTSRIALLTKKNQMIQVRILRDGKRKYFSANMIGTGLGYCKIDLLPTHEDIQKGDSVYAAPKPGILGGAYIIGEVAKIWPSNENPLLWDITVKPSVSAKDLKDVAVIIMDPKEVSGALD